MVNCNSLKKNLIVENTDMWGLERGFIQKN